MKKIFALTWMLFMVMSISFAQQKVTTTKTPATQQKVTTPTVTVASLSKAMQQQQKEIDDLKQLCKMQQKEIDRLEKVYDDLKSEYYADYDKDRDNLTDIKNRISDLRSEYYDDYRKNSDNIRGINDDINSLWNAIDRLK